MSYSRRASMAIRRGVDGDSRRRVIIGAFRYGFISG